MGKEIQTGHSQKNKLEVLKVQRNLRSASKKNENLAKTKQKYLNTKKLIWGQLRETVLVMHCECECSPGNLPGDNLATFY